MDIYAAFLLSSTFGFIVCAPTFPYDIVDLARDLGEQSMYWPTHHPFRKVVELTGSSTFGFWVYSNNINSTEHVGTHIDAPSHTSRYGWHLNQIPLSHLIGPGVIINVKDKVKDDPDYRVSVADVKEWEAKYGEIPDGAIVIMNSGWEKHYPDREKIFGTTDFYNTTSFHFPGFHEDAVSWIIKNRKMHVIGTDAPSFDYGQTHTFPVHIMTAKNNICGLENVGNLDAIPPNGAILTAAAVKTVEGSGVPVRLFAMVPQSGSGRVTAENCVAMAIMLCSLKLFNNQMFVLF